MIVLGLGNPAGIIEQAHQNGVIVCRYAATSSRPVGARWPRKARYEGKVGEGGLARGQSTGLIDTIEPAGKIVRDVMDEARLVLEERFTHHRDVASSSHAA